MGILYDDVVIISQSDKDGDPCVITVNCPDKTGLGCDLCRIILFFGLSIVRGDVSTDGKWCYIVFWVIGDSQTRWGLLKKRLMGACPSCSSASVVLYYCAEIQAPKPSDVFLLKLSCYDRKGLLYDVTAALCELELTIEKVKISTTPDGKVMDLFFVTDTRELLHTRKRKEDTYEHLKTILGNAMISCDVEMVSYGRFSRRQRGNCEIDLFIMQADGKKIVDPSKQNGLSSRLWMELLQPLRVTVVSRGPDTELLVANPVELSGKGRPLVFHDITLALKMLDICIFSAEIGRHMIGDREWEVYRVLLDEGDGLSVPRNKVEEGVWKLLMGWE